MSESAAPPAPETVNLTVDGVAVAVPKGTNVIEAARKTGLDVAAFCYHPGLSVVAVCRQCLVSIEGQPKLTPSCQAIATEGMVVHTKDKTSTLARKQMLEFTLLNHPIDCPICDKAGECTLQKLYFDHDNAPSRVDVPKVEKPKVVDLGPTVVLDAERCILCTRCIRVCDEVAGQHQLEMRHRGDHEELGTAPGAVLDNPYSINTVDVCPVGALTSKDFRFAMRAWELNTTPSVCTGCSTGCNIEVHHKDEQVWRLIPRPNPDVNGHWMCDEGRMTYHALRESRLVAPLVGGLPQKWESAVAKAAALLKPLLGSARESIGLVLSPHATNEDNYVFTRLAREFWQLSKIYMGGRTPVPERADKILRDSDVTPNRAGVVAILGGTTVSGAHVLAADLESGALRGLIMLGHETELAPSAVAKLSGLEAFVVIADTENQFAKAAHVALPSTAWAELSGTMTNRQNRVQRLHPAIHPPGQARPAWQIGVMLASATSATMTYEHPKQIFTEMVGKVAGLAGGEWGREARPIQLRFANSRG